MPNVLKKIESMVDKSLRKEMRWRRYFALCPSKKLFEKTLLLPKYRLQKRHIENMKFTAHCKWYQSAAAHKAYREFFFFKFQFYKNNSY